jgi:hypothetical protein
MGGLLAAALLMAEAVAPSLGVGKEVCAAAFIKPVDMDRQRPAVNQNLDMKKRPASNSVMLA